MLSIVTDESFLSPQRPGHPEAPIRIHSILEYLKQPPIAEKIEFVKPTKISSVDLELAHEKEYIEQLQQYSAEEFSGSPDNPFFPHTFKQAKLAAAAAMTAAKIAMHEDFAFSLARPPGHHAHSDKFSGFCYLNNIALATRKLLLEERLQNAMIIDFDLHHGDGTQQIFYDDPSIFYLSLHQDPATIFPFNSGFASENNPHIHNLPLPPGTTDAQYLHQFEIAVKKFTKEFAPEIIAISAGFDSFHLDKQYVGSQLKIQNSQTYFQIGKIIRSAADGCNSRSFAVLEGGYHPQTLGENCWNFLKAFL